MQKKRKKTVKNTILTVSNIKALLYSRPLKSKIFRYKKLINRYFQPNRFWKPVRLNLLLSSMQRGGYAERGV
jgi:hypothetical protein